MYKGVITIRLLIKIRPAGRELILPYNYQQILQGFIYRSLQNKEFSQFLHERGYTYGNRSFKLFSFSLFSGGRHKFNRENQTIAFTDEITWQVGSLIPEFIQDFGQSLLTSSSLNIHHQPIQIVEMTYRQPQILTTTCCIRMLSPITVYSTYQKENGKKITQYFSPNDPAFFHLIEENLKKKYEVYHKRKMPDNFQIRALKVTPKDKWVTRFKGFIINAWGGEYELKGTPEILTFACNASLGAKNSQGFGLFEVIS